MFVQLSQGLGSGYLGFSDRSIEVSAGLCVAVAKHPALTFDQADVFLGSASLNSGMAWAWRPQPDRGYRLLDSALRYSQEPQSGSVCLVRLSTTRCRSADAAEAPLTA